MGRVRTKVGNSTSLKVHMSLALVHMIKMHIVETGNSPDDVAFSVSVIYALCFHEQALLKIHQVWKRSKRLRNISLPRFTYMTRSVCLLGCLSLYHLIIGLIISHCVLSYYLLNVSSVTVSCAFVSRMRLSARAVFWWIMQT